MRVLTVALMAIVLTLVRAMPSAASCAPPVPFADRAALAVAVIHGTVVAVGGGTLTVRIDRVFKGDAPTPVRVFVGPGRGAGATSVDYAAGAGTEQMLYLIRGLDGELETNACIGDHTGPATGEELAYFGPGATPTAGSPDLPMQLAPLWAALALVVLGAIGALILRGRRHR